MAGWCRGLNSNKPFLVDGNSAVVKQVARGEAWIGLTDSDDIAAEQSEGSPVIAMPMTEETLLIPNTMAILQGARTRRRHNNYLITCSAGRFANG